METGIELNYQHLHYFWTVAREGSMTRAARRLRRSQPTVSAQVRALEQALGHSLFDRVGRRVELTEAGRLVRGYAAEIFELGQEMSATLAGQPADRPVRLAVGIADHLPKLLVARLLSPVLSGARPAKLVALEGRTDALLANLVRHELDLVLADAPPPSGAGLRVFSQKLGTSSIVLMASPKAAARYRRHFPRSLDGAPVLLPGPTSGLRRSLEAWFLQTGIRPFIAAECDDSALLKVLGSSGAGIFPVPAVIAAAVSREHGARKIGEARGVSESYYAITLERRIQNPAVAALLESTRRELG